MSICFKNTSGKVEIVPSVPSGDGSLRVPELIQKGLAHQQAGQLKKAEAIYQSILQKQPQHPGALHLLGVIAHQVGKNEIAVNLMERAIKANPRPPEFWNNCGAAYHALHKNDLAITRYQQAIAIKPDYAEAHNNLGNAFMELCRDEDAITCFEKAIAIKPDYAEAYDNLGNLFVELCRHEDAIACFERAIAVKPDYVRAYCDLGVLYERLHQVEKAYLCVQKVFQIQPNEPRSNRLHAILLKREGKYKEALDVLVNVPLVNIDNKAAASIHFELGKLYDLVNDSVLAIHHFEEGNRIHSGTYESTCSNKNIFLDKIKSLEGKFTHEWVQSWPELPLDSENDSIVFLVGFPRSGTTLLDQVLDSHPGIQVIEERPMIEDIEKKLDELPEGYPAALSSLSQSDVDLLRKEYLSHAEKYIDKQKGSIIIDKMPLNIVNIGLIYRLFPKAKIILALRHPCDVCLSNFMQRYEPNHAMASYSSLKGTAKQYDLVMRLWEKYVELLPINYTEVKYELVVDDFESEISRLLNFLGVDWDPALLDYSSHAKNRGIIRTPSYNQVTKPIYHHAKYRWQRYQEHLMPIMNKLEPHISYFNY